MPPPRSAPPPPRTLPELYKTAILCNSTPRNTPKTGKNGRFRVASNRKRVTLSPIPRFFPVRIRQKPRFSPPFPPKKAASPLSPGIFHPFFRPLGPLPYPTATKKAPLFLSPPPSPTPHGPGRPLFHPLPRLFRPSPPLPALLRLPSFPPSCLPSPLPHR